MMFNCSLAVARSLGNAAPGHNASSSMSELIRKIASKT